MRFHWDRWYHHPPLQRLLNGRMPPAHPKTDAAAILAQVVQLSPGGHQAPLTQTSPGTQSLLPLQATGDME